jgi:hypothetical protein
LNRFVFGYGNPVSYVDPLGLWGIKSWKAFAKAALITVGVGAAITIASFAWPATVAAILQALQPWRGSWEGPRSPADSISG